MHIINTKSAIFITIIGIFGINGCTNQPRYENGVCQSLPEEKTFVKNGVYVHEQHYLYTPDVDLKEAVAILIAKVENIEKTLYGKNAPDNTIIRVEPDINNKLDDMLSKVKTSDVKPMPNVSYSNPIEKKSTTKKKINKKKVVAKTIIPNNFKLFFILFNTFSTSFFFV